MTNIAKLGQEFGQYLIQLTSELLVQTGQPHSLSEMERKIRTMLLKAGQFLLGAWLTLQAPPLSDRKERVSPLWRSSRLSIQTGWHPLNDFRPS